MQRLDKHSKRSLIKFWVSIIVVLAVTSCNEGGKSVTYTLGGNVSGLTSSNSITLKNTSDGMIQSLVVKNNGNFVFSQPITSGSSYNVYVSSQPSNEVCSVANHSGNGSDLSSHVTNISIVCSAITYTLGGNVTGLSSNDSFIIKDADNNATLKISQNGSFLLPQPIASGSSYNVYVSNQPVGEACSIANHSGSGSDISSNVTNISVVCTTNSYTLGGNVVGLPYGEFLRIKDMDNNATLKINQNGSFTFGQQIAFGGSYNVAVITEPSSKICSVDNESGVNIEMNINNIKINCTTEKVLYSFASSPDGMYPRANLLQGLDGNFYGTTYTGGEHNHGTVFKMTPDGVESIVYSFAGQPSDGANPVASLIQDNMGNLYGTTRIGGEHNNGTVFKITPAGIESILHSFGNNDSHDGQNPEAGLILDDTNNNLCGTTTNGGEHNKGTVFKITMSDNKESILHSFGQGKDGQNPVASLIEGPDSLYGTTYGGGEHEQGTVFKIRLSDNSEGILYSFNNSNDNDGQNPFASLIQDSSGNFYGTTQNGGANNEGTVFKITPAGTESILHSFGDNDSHDGQLPTAGLIQDTRGNLYGTTPNGGANSNGTVFKVTTNGNESTIYSFGNLPDGQSPAGSLIQGAQGNLYGITEGGGKRYGTVFKIAIAP